MQKCCFFDILFLYCFLEKRYVYILTGFQMVTKSQNRFAELRKSSSMRSDEEKYKHTNERYERIEAFLGLMKCPNGKTPSHCICIKIDDNSKEVPFDYQLDRHTQYNGLKYHRSFDSFEDETLVILVVGYLKSDKTSEIIILTELDNIQISDGSIEFLQNEVHNIPKAKLSINNGRAILTEDDVKVIRNAYANHLRRKDVYLKFKDKISFATFANVWDGSTWGHVMPEVFTKENKTYYSKEATNGEKSFSAKFTNEEVIHLRERYVNEDARSIYEDYKDRCSYTTLQQILWGRTYKNLPIYKKKEKKWINK